MHEPTKKGILSKTILWIVATETDMERYFLEKQFSVHRTFDDFLWLREALRHAHPECVIPPLPKKQTTTQSVDDYFIKKRTQSLQRFLHRLVNHPTLRIEQNLRNFLNLDEKELKSYMKEVSKDYGKSRKHYQPRQPARRPDDIACAKGYIIMLESDLRSLVEKVESNSKKGIVYPDPENVQQVIHDMALREPPKGYMSNVLKAFWYTFPDPKHPERSPVKAEEETAHTLHLHLKDLVMYCRVSASRRRRPPPRPALR